METCVRAGPPLYRGDLADATRNVAFSGKAQAIEETGVRRPALNRYEDPLWKRGLLESIIQKALFSFSKKCSIGG